MSSMYLAKNSEFFLLDVKGTDCPTLITPTEEPEAALNTSRSSGAAQWLQIRLVVLGSLQL